MKNIKMAETAARYGTARAFEKLLERVGWMKDGCLLKKPVEQGYMVGDHITPFGQGYLFEASRE